MKRYTYKAVYYSSRTKDAKAIVEYILAATHEQALLYAQEQAKKQLAQLVGGKLLKVSRKDAKASWDTKITELD